MVEEVGMVEDDPLAGGAVALWHEGEEGPNPRRYPNLAAALVTSRWQRESGFEIPRVEWGLPKQRQLLHRQSPISRALAEPNGWHQTIAGLLPAIRSTK